MTASLKRHLLTGGTWVDGKPIYRKVVPVTGPAGTVVNHPHGISYETVIQVGGGLQSPDAGNWVPLPFAHTDNSSSYQNIELSIQTNVVELTSNEDFSGLSGYVIIEYTKLSAP